jgi:hypothetical protein
VQRHAPGTTDGNGQGAGAPGEPEEVGG